MKILKVSVLTMLIAWQAVVWAAGQAVLVHNTKQEIDSCMGKLQLKLVRTWGGDEDNDEHKFFKFPGDVVVDGNNVVYICDQFNFNIKVFDRNGKYLRTIGQKGRGPGDLIGPWSISVSPDGSLWVAESGGRRIQAFNPAGKSQAIIKNNDMIKWLAVTGKNEIAVYAHYKTFKSRTLLSIYTTGGKLLREIGSYHDKSKTLFGSEHLIFTKDNKDNFLASNTWLPVIRKYSPDGRLILVITYDTPFIIPVTIALNDQGDEIVRSGDGDSQKEQVKMVNDGYVFNNSNANGKWEKIRVGCGLQTDMDENIYIAVLNRRGTEEEEKATLVTLIGYSAPDRSAVDFDLVESSDAYSLYVFNPAGKIIAATKLTTYCNGIYISGNRLFVIDGELNQRILEYEMTLDLQGNGAGNVHR